MDYINAIIERDISYVTRVEQLNAMPNLIRVLAEHSGRMVNYSRFGAVLGMNHVTTRNYVGVLEKLFIIRTLQPWYINTLKSLRKTPKLHFLDSGLLAALKGISSDRLIHERIFFGPLLESFVFSEILKLASWSDDWYIFSHFRDKKSNEVDIVIENGHGQVVGIEVKASATITKRDFSGLRHLATACDKRFALGLVLHDHDQTVPFGDRMFAAPISILWS